MSFFFAFFMENDYAQFHGDIMEKKTATILVVDDEQLVRFMLKEFLEEMGFHVITAENGKEALTVLSMVLVDCILLDLNMPVMGGAQLVREMRTKGLLVPVVVVSGVCILEEDVDREVCAVLKKPFSFKNLLTVLSECLTDSRTP